MDTKTGINDFVWAKMTGYPPWPSIVLQPFTDIPDKPNKDDSGTDFQWVYFFGSQNFAWIETTHLKPYDRYKEKFTALYKTQAFNEAVEEIEEVLSQLKEDPGYLPGLIEEIKQKKKKREPVKRKSGSGKRAVSTKSRRTERARISFENRYNSDSESSSSTSVKLPFDQRHSVLRTRDINASDLTFGVLGIGNMGREVVRNLVMSGHKVNIWNRTVSRCTELEEELEAYGSLRSNLTPRYVMARSDIVFVCVSDHTVAKKIVQDYFGINDSSDTILSGKGLVVMTCIDPESSKDIGDMICKKEGMYLEAQVQKSRPTFDQGEDNGLIVLAAGSERLFYDCQSCFKAMGKTSIFLGEVGYASKMNLILQMIKGVSLVGLAEGFALAERCNVFGEGFINIFNMTSLACGYLKEKAAVIVKKNFGKVELSLQNMQKDMMLGLELSNQIGQPMDLASVANELFKHCKKLEYGNQDASSIFMRTHH